MKKMLAAIVCLSFLSAGCYAFRDLPVQDNLSKEDMDWIFQKQDSKNRDKYDSGRVAITTRIQKLWLSDGRLLQSCEPGFWRHEGAFRYGEGYAYGLPIPLFGLKNSESWYDRDGKNLGYSRHFSLMFTLAPVFARGEFHHEKGTQKSLDASFAGCHLVGILPADWYFRGDEGTYWHVIWGAFGHISTPQTRTVVFLYFPIRYSSQ